jgi:hypothetical protein
MRSDVTLAPQGNPRGSGYERAADDWYREPRWAIDALLGVETFDGVVWDPACGLGNIPDACRARGYTAVGTDVVQRGAADMVLDFLGTVAQAADNIVTNPPFGISQQFALKALGLVTGKVCILQHTTWLEGQSRYEALWSKGHLARVWQFSRRVSMPPGGSDVPARGGSKAFAWFVFDPSHKGPFTGGWLP